MRNAIAIAVAAAFLGSIPAAAQMRRTPVLSRISPVRTAPRGVRFSRVRPAPARVRVVYTRPVPNSSQQQQTEAGMATVPPIGVSATPQPSNSAFAPSGGTPIPLGQLLNPVPGLGFDYNHLAAINSGLAIRAIIDPVTQHELSTVESLPEQAPVGLGYFPAFAAEGPAYVGASQPQVIVVQQPVASSPRAITAAAPTPIATAAATPPPPPLPVGVLYLVRRSGAVIHAIAFSQRNGQVIYITANGLRHSVALSELNIKATEQRNAEHGTVVHLTS